MLQPVLIDNFIAYLDHINKKLILNVNDESKYNEFDTDHLNYNSVMRNFFSDKQPQIPQVPNININTDSMVKELHATKEFFDKEKESN